MPQKFSEYAIIDEITHHFEKRSQWWWKIKPPTSGDEIALSKFLNTPTFKWDGTQRVEVPLSTIEVAHREIALTYAGTNIPQDNAIPVEEGGEPLLKPFETVEMIEVALKEMPNTMIFELWKAVKQAAPTWGPADPKKPGEKENSEGNPL
jgi:hypothetical protein